MGLFWCELFLNLLPPLGSPYTPAPLHMRLPPFPFSEQVGRCVPEGVAESFRLTQKWVPSPCLHSPGEND